MNVQRSLVFEESTLQQAKELQEWGFGKLSKVIQVAVDRMYHQEAERARIRRSESQQTVWTTEKVIEVR